jgi:hypothetical protein
LDPVVPVRGALSRWGAAREGTDPASGRTRPALNSIPCLSRARPRALPPKPAVAPHPETEPRRDRGHTGIERLDGPDRLMPEDGARRVSGTSPLRMCRSLPQIVDVSIRHARSFARRQPESRSISPLQSPGTACSRGSRGRLHTGGHRGTGGLIAVLGAVRHCETARVATSAQTPCRRQRTCAVP